MKLYHIKAVQRVPISLEDAWAFFSSPENLRLITPAFLDFRITNEVPKRMYPGTIITYTVRPILGIPLPWVTEITHLDEPNYFIDEQRSGPYRIWHHQHHFKAIAGGVELTDIVHYGLPLGPLGRLMNTLTVGKRVEEIFSFRREALEKMFGVWKGAGPV